jgi:hypothetical protein
LCCPTKFAGEVRSLALMFISIYSELQRKVCRDRPMSELSPPASCSFWASSELLLFQYGHYGWASTQTKTTFILNQLIPAGHCACQSATIFKCDTCLQCSASKKPLGSPARYSSLDH